MGKTRAEEELRLYIDYDTSSEGGEICEGEEGSEWPSHEPEIRSVTFNGIYRSNPQHKFFVDSHMVSMPVFNSPVVYMVVVRYQTGGTFGCSQGCHEVINIFSTSAEAEDLKNSIQDDSYPGYKCWEGYFERLEGVEIHRFDVKN